MECLLSLWSYQVRLKLLQIKILKLLEIKIIHMGSSVPAQISFHHFGKEREEKTTARKTYYKPSVDEHEQSS